MPHSPRGAAPTGGCGACGVCVGAPSRGEAFERFETAGDVRPGQAQRATLTPSRLAKEVSLAVSRKSRMNGESSMSVRIAA